MCEKVSRSTIAVERCGNLVCRKARREARRGLVDVPTYDEVVIENASLWSSISAALKRHYQPQIQLVLSSMEMCPSSP